MKKLFAVFTLLTFIVACIVKIYRDTHSFKLETITYDSPKLPKRTSLSILQISDLHNRVFGTDNEQLVNAVKKANADMIVLTGDLIDRKTTTFDHVFSLIEQLTAINKRVFFVPGNHEWGNARTSEFLHGLHERHVTILSNQNVQMTKGDVTVNIAGVDDPATEHDNLSDAFSQINDDDYTILLAHAPDIVHLYDTIPADLILSGHTHGGQIRFPFIGALVAPGQGFFPRLDKGTYQLGPDQYLYIDSGLGTTRMPVRFLNQSQLSLMTIAARHEKE
ncbi:metallophosphoesterase [Lentibacillus salinarum]|uniref:Metallophosphoesterase n=1 Tax=Lentibacillus salinarum TaxID=446820 RepID=A0ABW3ZW71_9BACI